MDVFATQPAARQWPACQHVFFDCDSTLSKIEGIDALAKQPGELTAIAGMTNSAMAGECALEDIYEKRLDMLRPTRTEIGALTEKYRRHIVEDAELVVSILMEYGIQVYVVSGGLIEPVEEFSRSLGIPASHVHAVPLKYDELGGDWWRRDSPVGVHNHQSYIGVDQSHLVNADGKIHVIKSILAGKTGRSALVGDGVSDLLAADVVDLFVGFGGVTCRDLVEKKAATYVQSASLLPIVPLVMGSMAFRKLAPDLVEHTRQLCARNPVSFRSHRQEKSFQLCFA